MEQNRDSRSRPTNVWLTDFSAMPREFNERKDSFCNKWCWDSWISTWNKMNLKCYIILHTNELKVNRLSHKISRKKSLGFWLSKYFLGYIRKKKLKLIKLKKLWSSKDIVKIMKSKPQTSNFQYIYLTNNLYQNIESLYNSTIGQTTQLKNRWKVWTDMSYAVTYVLSIHTFLNAQQL